MLVSAERETGVGDSLTTGYKPGVNLSGADNTPVAYLFHSWYPSGKVTIVRHHDDGLALPYQLLEKLKDQARQIPGWGSRRRSPAP